MHTITREEKAQKPNKRQDWGDIAYLKSYLKNLQELFHLKDDQWHKLTTRQVIRLRGRGMLHRYKSIQNAVQVAFPHVKVQEKGWGNVHNIRTYLKELQENYQIKNDEWHLVTKQQLLDFKGSGLLDRYRNLENILKLAFPDADIKLRDQHDWTDINYIRNYLNQLQKYYQIKDDEWHLITRKKVIDFNGAGMLRRYKTVKLAALAAFPNLEIKGRNIRNWKDVDYLRTYLAELRNHYQIGDNWHLITNKDIVKFHGSGLLTRYKTLSSALSIAFPGTEFNLPKPGQFNDDPNKVKEVVFKIEKKLYIRQTDDWYRVSTTLFSDFGGKAILNTGMKMIDILRLCYPDITWDESRLVQRNKKAEQFFLRNTVKQLFPHYEIIEDYLHPISNSKGQGMEMDLYLPDIKLGFEYQGRQHFEDVPYFGPIEMYKQRDEDKKRICLEQGIYLVAVPHWWDRSMEDLRERISKVCTLSVLTNSK